MIIVIKHGLKSHLVLISVDLLLLLVAYTDCHLLEC